MNNENVKIDCEQLVNWWKSATVEQREEFLYQIGSYPVSEYTWYVHPEDKETKPDVRINLPS